MKIWEKTSSDSESCLVILIFPLTFFSSLESESSDLYYVFCETFHSFSRSLFCYLIPFKGNFDESEAFLKFFLIRWQNNDAWLGRLQALHTTFPCCGHPSGCVDLDWPHMAHWPGWRSRMWDCNFEREMLWEWWPVYQHLICWNSLLHYSSMGEQ